MQVVLRNSSACELGRWPIASNESNEQGSGPLDLVAAIAANDELSSALCYLEAGDTLTMEAGE